MKLFARFLEDDLRGVHYAVNIFIATTVLWIVVKVYGDYNPIWAISSMIATSDPQIKMLCRTTRSTPVELERDFQTSVAEENGNDDDPDSPARQGYGDPRRAVHKLRARRQVVEADDE
jgi:hypothetical protein